MGGIACQHNMATTVGSTLLVWKQAQDYQELDLIPLIFWQEGIRVSPWQALDPVAGVTLLGRIDRDIFGAGGYLSQTKSALQLTNGSPGPIFYVLSWSLSHLEFFLQVTWPFSFCTPSDLDAKSLGKIFGCWLGDILGPFCIIICILYLFKFIYVTLYGMFYNICTKGSQSSLHWVQVTCEVT